MLINAHKWNNLTTPVNFRELAEEESIRLGERVHQLRETTSVESDKIGILFCTFYGPVTMQLAYPQDHRVWG